MKADYKNWVPKGMEVGFLAGAGVLAASEAEIRMDKLHIEKNSVQETLVIPLYARKVGSF